MSEMEKTGYLLFAYCGYPQGISYFLYSKDTGLNGQVLDFEVLVQSMEHV